MCHSNWWISVALISFSVQEKTHMHIQLTTIILSALFITGCSSTGSTNQNQTAAKIVSQVSPSHIERPKLQALTSSFEENSGSSPYSGSVVELSGEVISFASTEDNLYTVTLRNGDSEVLCIFNDSISGQLGDGRVVFNGATITIQGQCFASGLFSANAFSLDGCRIVSN